MDDSGLRERLHALTRNLPVDPAPIGAITQRGRRSLRVRRRIGRAALGLIAGSAIATAFVVPHLGTGQSDSTSILGERTATAQLGDIQIPQAVQQRLAEDRFVPVTGSSSTAYGELLAEQPIEGGFVRLVRVSGDSGICDLVYTTNAPASSLVDYCGPDVLSSRAKPLAVRRISGTDVEGMTFSGWAPNSATKIRITVEGHPAEVFPAYSGGADNWDVNYFVAPLSFTGKAVLEALDGSGTVVATFAM